MGKYIIHLLNVKDIFSDRCLPNAGVEYKNGVIRVVDISAATKMGLRKAKKLNANLISNGFESKIEKK